MVKGFVNFLKESGFIFQSSQIYGGMANSWDFGPLGVEIKKNIKDLWWKKFVYQNPYVEGIDSSIILLPKVWEASGHLKNFNELLIECKSCNKRFRINDLLSKQQWAKIKDYPINQIESFLKTNQNLCLNCDQANFSQISFFNLMFEVNTSLTNTKSKKAFLRPETAQGMFINFNNFVRATRKNLPFGIAQIGKAFRNEITPSNLIFKTKEFEQMELEFFFDPSCSKNWFNYYQDQIMEFLNLVGIKSQSLVIKNHSKEELAHYSQKTIDFEFKFPFGQKELCGLAHRGNYDLNAHNKYANEKLKIHDSSSQKDLIPEVIEPSFGLERLILAVLLECYHQSQEREVLKLPFSIAPVKVAILPLIKKLHYDKSWMISQKFSKICNTRFESNGSIGKRYKKQDKIGTPFCITVDDQTLRKEIITLRSRDDSLQETMTISEALTFIKEKMVT